MSAGPINFFLFGKPWQLAINCGPKRVCMWNLLWLFCIPWFPVSPVDSPINEQWGWEVDRWYPIVVDAAQSYGAEDQVDVFMRVMHCESRGDPRAVNSSSGASGLMQHMPEWWDWRAEEAGFSGYSPFDPVANIWVSFWLLTLPDIGGWKHWECY